MSELTVISDRLTDPVHFIVADVVKRSTNRKMPLLIDAVMGKLPAKLPAWALPIARVGVHRLVKAELKRRGYVVRNGTYRRFAELPLREAWGYVADLETSSDRDISRIKRHKADLKKAERIAGSIDDPRPIGELLGWSGKEGTG